MRLLFLTLAAHHLAQNRRTTAFDGSEWRTL